MSRNQPAQVRAGEIGQTIVSINVEETSVYSILLRKNGRYVKSYLIKTDYYPNFKVLAIISKSDGLGRKLLLSMPDQMERNIHPRICYDGLPQFVVHVPPPG